MVNIYVPAETNKRCQWTRIMYYLNPWSLSWLLLDLYMSSFNVGGLDPWGVTCEKCSDDQVSKRLSKVKS